MLRSLVAIVVAIGLITGAIYVAAGRGAPPGITIGKPDKVVGQTGALEVTAEAPNGRLTALTVTLEQNGRTTPLFALAGTASPGLTQVDRDHVRVTRDIGKRTLPELQAGAARIVVSATRPSFLNLRRLSSTATKDFQVRLDPPRVAVISTHHYVNHGGSEMV